MVEILKSCSTYLNRKNKANEGLVNLKIFMTLYVNKTFTDGHIRRHPVLMAKVVLYFSLTVLMIHLVKIRLYGSTNLKR